jgi:hypothetical protein
MIRVAAVSDFNYLFYIKALFTSFLKHNSNVYFYLYYVGNEEISQLLNFPNLKIYQDNIIIKDNTVIKSVDTEDVVYKKYFDQKNFVSRKACYCNNIRFQFASKLLEENVSNFFLMDADMICNKDIQSIKVISRKYDLCIQPYFEDRAGNINEHGDKYYCVNFMYVNNTEQSRLFFNNLSKTIKEEFGIYKWGHAKFFKEQLFQYKNLKVLDMPWIYRDTNYNENSYIWSGENFRKNSKLVQQSTNEFKFIDQVEKYNNEYSIRLNN